MICVRTWTEATQTFVAEISDSGIGIDPANLERIFHAFEQEQTPERRQQGGLRLGLAICHKLVALHDGRITAQSAGLGKGATFRIELPLSLPDPPSQPDHPAQARAPNRARN